MYIKIIKEVMIKYIIMIEKKVVVCGPVDAGKSSLIGVLKNGILDNGRGSSRESVLKHYHELSSGRTSNITVNTYSYKKLDNILQVVNNNKLVKVINNNDIMCSNSIINLIDLAGHEKYLKTTVFGMLAYYPNYGMVVIGANTGVTKLTKEHLGIMFYLDIPFSIVITKVDITPDKIYKKLINRLKRIFQSLNRDLYEIDSDKQTQDFINSNSDKIPIISISNKTGKNINNLHYLINNIPKVNTIEKKDNSMMFIDSKFNVPGIGLVVCGTNFGKKFKIKDKAFIGPLNGKFYPINIRSIHNSLSENVNETYNGGYFGFAIKFNRDVLTKRQIKKGMVIVDSIDKIKEMVSDKFIARVKVLHHSTLIKEGYCPLIHLGSIRQSAKLKIIDTQSLKSGDMATVEFKFLYQPELILEGQKLFFRDGNTKGVGTVISV